jgi:hypothetical protein
MWARKHFVELGQKLVAFYDNFVKARKSAKRGKKRYIPTEEELRAAFGEDWTIVRDAWPAVPFLAQVLALQATPSMSEDEKTAREEACWIEAEAFLAVLRPNKVEEGDFIELVRRKVSKLRKKTDDRPGLVNDVLEYVFADPAGLRERLLVYAPRGKVDAVLRYWTRAFKNAARDAIEPRMLGVMDDQPGSSYRSACPTAETTLSAATLTTKIIERFLGARRGMRTVGAAAREAGVPVERAVDLIQRLAVGMGLDRERVVSPKKTIPAEVYEILVDKLRENVPAVAATGGSAKPRTS